MSDLPAVPTPAELGEMALAWRRTMRVFDALPWGSHERNEAYIQVCWAGEQFWQAVDAALDSAPGAAGEGA